MSKLDDIEKLARDYRDSCADTGNTGCIGDDLARALLAVMPVVRQAERVRTASAACTPQLDSAEFDRAYAAWVEQVAKIDAAVEQMHAEIGRGR